MVVSVVALIECESPIIDGGMRKKKMAKIWLVREGNGGKKEKRRKKNS